MKTKKITSHLNNDNKGFSLIELIVTMAIMVVFVAVAIISSSVIDTSRVQEVERGIDDFVGLARSKSMSVSAKHWYMELTTKDGVYVTKLYKVEEVEVSEGVYEDKVIEVDREEYNDKVSVTFSFKDGVDEKTYTIDENSPLCIYFSSTTGKVSDIQVDGSSVNISSGIGHIKIAAQSDDATLKFFYNTGKIERE